VASPGFVVRRGKDGNYVMGHSQWTSEPGAAAALWLIVLWLMQYWSKDLWVVDICISKSHRLQNTWIVWALRFTQKWTKNEIVGSQGGTCLSAPYLATPLCRCVRIRTVSCGNCNKIFRATQDTAGTDSHIWVCKNHYRFTYKIFVLCH